MLLHELGRDTWTVLAIARSETECELKEVLAQPDSNDLGARMSTFLKYRLPAMGPPHNEVELDKARRLRGDYLLAKRRNLLEIISID